MNRFLVKTFGCQMNKDDSERIAGLLSGIGYQQTDSPDQARLIIFNTCCVRQNADDRAWGQVSAAKKLKSERPDLIIAVGGCLAQNEGRKMADDLGHIDIVFGTHNVSRLPRLLQTLEMTGKPQIELLDSAAEFAADLPAVRQHAWHAWLPITVGCDNFCSYCIVPHVRGREKSRAKEALVAEAERLAADGVVEVTLLGQNVNSYGRDLCGRPDFADLLCKIADVRGLDRIRFTTSHPKDLTDEVISAVASRENICPHFHLPLQSGSDRVLKFMHRRYTRGEYLELVDKIRDGVRDVAITTDIMVGFPGETETDFEQTLEVVKAARFDQAFTFIYSPRPGTAAAEHEDPIGPEEKSKWFSRLVETQNLISLETNIDLIGRRADVFVESLSKKDRFRLAARMGSNKLIHIDGPDEMIGTTLKVEIEAAYSWFLLGRTVAPL